MKRWTLFVICMALLLCACGCFKSTKKDGDASAAADAKPAVTTKAAASTAPASTTKALQATVGYVNTGSSDTLNVRPQPNTIEDPVGGLPNGEQVKIIGEEGDFYKIEFNDQTGSYAEKFAYVSKQYVTVAGGETAKTTGAPVSDPKQKPIPTTAPHQ